MGSKKILNKLIKLKKKFIDKAHDIEHAAVRETKETYKASLILFRMLQGKEINKKDIKFLRGQTVDIGKALTIIGLQAIPFSSAAIIAIEVVANKNGFSIFPTSQSDESETSENQQTKK